MSRHRPLKEALEDDVANSTLDQRAKEVEGEITNKKEEEQVKGDVNNKQLRSSANKKHTRDMCKVINMCMKILEKEIERYQCNDHDKHLANNKITIREVVVNKF